MKTRPRWNISRSVRFASSSARAFSGSSARLATTPVSAARAAGTANAVGAVSSIMLNSGTAAAAAAAVSRAMSRAISGMAAVSLQASSSSSSSTAYRLWPRSTAIWLAARCPKPVRRLWGSVPVYSRQSAKQKNHVVRRSGFATFLLYNIPQAEPSAVVVSSQASASVSASVSAVATSGSKSPTKRKHLAFPSRLSAGGDSGSLWDLLSPRYAIQRKSSIHQSIAFSASSVYRSFHTSSTRRDTPPSPATHHSDHIPSPISPQKTPQSKQANSANSKPADTHSPSYVNALPDDSIYNYSYFPLPPHEPSLSLPRPAASPNGKQLPPPSPRQSLPLYSLDSHHYYIPSSSPKTTTPSSKPPPSNSGAGYYESWMPRVRSGPSRDELLASATNSLQRLNIRLRWALFKQVRPITTDDISAFFSWILVGNIIWILLGTTTFFSLVLFTMNTVFAQEYIAQIIGNFITKNTGLTVVFENAIVPHWNDGMISFNKVFVSRRPNRGNHRVQKGSQAAAAADAAASSSGNCNSDSAALNKPVDTGNYTQFDLTIDTVSVTLSVSKWMNGGGIVQDVEVKGLRGIVDRRMVKWDPNDNPVNYKNVHKPGDFEIENFKMEDALVTLYHPNDFRPFRVSIFSCELPRLRKHWLLYDILSANNMSGTYDNSLFTIHPRQLENVSSFNSDTNNNPTNPWRKINRLRVDGVNIDHLNRGIQGPFGWIESGNVDMVADIMFPAEEENINFAQVLRDIKATWINTSNTNSMQSYRNGRKEWNSSLIVPGADSAPSTPQSATAHKYIVLDLRVQLNNSRAVVPLFTTGLTYINNALIRPIVAYINSRDTYIPINCRIVKRYDDFEGSWTMYDSRLMDDISAAVYDAFAANIMDDEARAMRMKKVGFWSLQLALQLFLLSLGAIA